MAERVKAEYFSAKDKATGEVKEVQFIPPAPSDGDLGGISQEKLEQIDKLKGDLTSVDSRLSESIVEIADIKKSRNLLNPANVKTGFLYKPIADTDGRMVMQLLSDTAYSCAFFEVEKGNEYIVSSVAYNCYNADKDGYATGIACYSSSGTTLNAIMDTNAVNTSYNNTDKTTTRVYISWRHATTSLDKFMVVKGNVLPQEYEAYGDDIVTLQPSVSVSYNQLKDVPGQTGNVYIVSSDGDFRTLTEALVALKDDASEKIIYVESGTYNVYEEIGGDAFVNSIPPDASSYWDYVTIVPPNTSIIGIGYVRLEYLPTIDVPSVAKQFISPINISDGNIHLENIEIVCKQCRYAIHDQTRNAGNWRHTYKNVKCIKDDETSTYGGKVQAFGCGFANGMKFDFDSCYFESHHAPFSFHNAGNAYGSILIKNTITKASNTAYKDSPTIRFGNVSVNQTHIPVVLSNCYIGNGLLTTNESTTQRPNAYDITLLGCLGNLTVNNDCETNIYEAKAFN